MRTMANAVGKAPRQMCSPREGASPFRQEMLPDFGEKLQVQQRVLKRGLVRAAIAYAIEKGR